MLAGLQEFLDSIIADEAVYDSIEQTAVHPAKDDSTTAAQRTINQPKSSTDEHILQPSATNLARTIVHDFSVEVVVAPLADGPGHYKQKPDKKFIYKHAIQASCIISIWSTETSQYFTLTFTSATDAEITQPVRSSRRIVYRTSTSSMLSKSHRSNSSSSSGQHSGRSTSTASKPVTPALSHAEFPPRGPPQKGKNDLSASASVFQKATQLKDAILNSISMPAYGS